MQAKFVGMSCKEVLIGHHQTLPKLVMLSSDRFRQNWTTGAWTTIRSDWAAISSTTLSYHQLIAKADLAKTFHLSTQEDRMWSIVRERNLLRSPPGSRTNRSDCWVVTKIGHPRLTRWVEVEAMTIIEVITTCLNTTNTKRMESVLMRGATYGPTQALLLEIGSKPSSLRERTWL